MPAQRGMQNDVARRNHASGGGVHDRWVRTAEVRRLQAEASAKGVRRGWTNATRMAAPRYPLNVVIADAIGRGALRLARVVRRSIVEPYARRRRRKIAIAELGSLDDHLLADIGLTRGQIEVAVDGMLRRRGKPFSRPVGRGVPAEEARHELPTAA